MIKIVLKKFHVIFHDEKMCMSLQTLKQNNQLQVK